MVAQFSILHVIRPPFAGGLSMQLKEQVEWCGMDGLVQQWLQHTVIEVVLTVSWLHHRMQSG